MKKILGTFLALGVLLTLVGCMEGESGATEDVTKQQSAQSELIKAQPYKTLDWSLERDMLSRRIEIMNNKDAVWYVYLIEFDTVVAEYAIKGKVSSVNSMMTPDYVEESDWGSSSATTISTQLPDDYGSYGDNGAGIFFFTVDGAYVEWNGKYLVSSVPMNLSTNPLVSDNNE